MTDVASGQVAYATETVAAAMPLVRAGRLRAYGITLARRLADQGVRSVADYRDYLLRNNREPHTLGIVHPASMHNLLLRYWLAAGGINPLNLPGGAGCETMDGGMAYDEVLWSHLNS